MTFVNGLLRKRSGPSRPATLSFHVVWLLALVPVLALCGCGMTGDVTRVDEKRKAAAEKIAPGDAITIIGLSLSEAAEEMLGCVDDEVRNVLHGARIMRSLDFRDRMFPWFEPNLAPRDTKSLSELMSRAAVRERIAALHVRYVVAISGSTDVKNTSWGIAIAGGYPPAAFVFGGMGTDEKTVLIADILDMKKIQNVGTIETTAEGGTEIGLLVAIPYAYSVSSMKGACKMIAQRVAGYVTGKPEPSPPAESPAER